MGGLELLSGLTKLARVKMFWLLVSCIERASVQPECLN